MKINQIIRQRRRELSLTQEQVAAYLGVSTPAVNKWEKGSTYPDITLLPQLAAFFHLTIDELMGYEPQLTQEEIRAEVIALQDRPGTGVPSRLPGRLGQGPGIPHVRGPAVLRRALSGGRPVPVPSPTARGVPDHLRNMVSAVGPQ